MTYTVTQEDRVACADHAIERGLVHEFNRQPILAGTWDDWPPLQAFAKHRTEATKELVEACRAALDEDSGLMCADALRIAIARATGGQS